MSLFRAFLLLVLVSLPTFATDCFRDVCRGDTVIYQRQSDAIKYPARVIRILDRGRKNIEVRFINKDGYLGRLAHFNLEDLHTDLGEVQGLKSGERALSPFNSEGRRGTTLVRVEHIYATGDALISFPNGKTRLTYISYVYHELEENNGLRVGDEVKTRHGFKATILGLFDNNQSVLERYDTGEVWFDDMAGLEKL